MLYLGQWIGSYELVYRVYVDNYYYICKSWDNDELQQFTASEIEGGIWNNIRPVSITYSTIGSKYGYVESYIPVGDIYHSPYDYQPTKRYISQEEAVTIHLSNKQCAIYLNDNSFFVASNIIKDCKSASHSKGTRSYYFVCTILRAMEVLYIHEDYDEIITGLNTIKTLFTGEELYDHNLKFENISKFLQRIYMSQNFNRLAFERIYKRCKDLFIVDLTGERVFHMNASVDLIMCHAIFVGLHVNYDFSLKVKEKEIQTRYKFVMSKLYSKLVKLNREEFEDACANMTAICEYPAILEHLSLIRSYYNRILTVN